MTGAPTAFLGLSHLGVVSSVCWASLGASVIAIDSDAAVVEDLRRGRLPVEEPGLVDALAQARARIRFLTDPAAASDSPLVVVARDVPTDAADASDPSVVTALVDAVTPHLSPGVTVVVMSQVSPGFTRDLARRVRARRPDLDFHLYYWVETLVIGDAVQRCLRPERIILGCEDPALALSPALAGAVARFGCPVLPLRYESAELTKTAINLYLCAGVTYANTLADLCEAVGADWAEIVPALRMDRRIGAHAYIRPGPGIAGGNLERDLVTLATLCRTTGVDGRLIETMLDLNRRRLDWVHRSLDRYVLSGRDRPVLALWGLAYKRNTRSTRNSPALRMVARLADRADVRAWDPAVAPDDVPAGIKMVADRDEALAGADGLVIMTDWPDFARPKAEALASMRRAVVVDAVGVVEPDALQGTGVTYVTMGRA